MTERHKATAEQIIDLHKSKDGKINWEEIPSTIDLTPALPALSSIKSMLINDLKYIRICSTNNDLWTELTKLGWEFKSFAEEEAKKKEQTELETISQAKQWFETENARMQFEDYPKTKSRLARSEVISYASIAIALATLMQQWLCNKHD